MLANPYVAVRLAEREAWGVEAFAETLSCVKRGLSV
jgi:hypothetical protein